MRRAMLTRSGVCAVVAAAAGVPLICVGTAGAKTLKVTTTTDPPGGHRCSLREAIVAVDAPGTRTRCGTGGHGSNTIVLRAGRYRLSVMPSGADDNTTGDLNVTRAARLTITGAGAGPTVIDATGIGDRALSIAPGAHVTLSRFTITGGRAPDGSAGASGTASLSCGAGGAGGPGSAGDNGGGIANSGTLVLSTVVVTGNTGGGGGRGGAGASACGGGNGGQGGSGGGIFNTGRLTLTGSTVRANTAGTGGTGGTGGSSVATGGPGGGGGVGGAGGGIYNQGELSVTTSFISSDRAGAGGAGGPGGAGTSGRGPSGAGGPGASGGGLLSSSGALRVVNTTLFGNLAGAGATGGVGGSGGAVQVRSGTGTLVNATIAHNEVGPGGAGGGSGSGAGLSVLSSARLENTIVASNVGSGCAGSTRSAIVNGGHDLSYGDQTCPGPSGNPKLGSPRDNGGPTETLALTRGSAAINGVPKAGADCPATDQRAVRRPEGRACDIGAFEFAVPHITIIRPGNRASYERDSRVRAQFRCTEGGITSPIAACRATVRAGRGIDTRSVGTKHFRVIAIDKTGNRTVKTVHYSVWAYVNPVGAVSGLGPYRIDMGVDYSGSGPLLALGDAKVTFASNNDAGPLSCWGISCWPGGGIVVYRLTDGPFAGKYVYDAENVTATVRVAQRVKAGQQVAILHFGSPNMETGWASGRGAETLSFADGHQCTCGDPGGWSAIEGRNFNGLLVLLGAPGGFLQAGVPSQSMPRGWPALPSRVHGRLTPRSPGPTATRARPGWGE